MDTARILVVDDDLKSQKILRDLLTPDGYELAFAATGFAALQEAARKAPDVILLDVLMPDMDGFEVCRHLRLDPLLAEVSIIMVTSLDDHASRLRGLEVGADEFVTKPFDMIELRARVRNVAQLNRYRKLLHERTKAQRAQAETMSSSEATLAAWVRILERDGRVIPGRCDRVMALALRMGEAMELADADLVSLRWSVLLQSISAMAVPSALRSEGPCIRAD
jgi:putative two-component system response regulator